MASNEEAILLLKRSLLPIPQELNELDWKQGLSNNKERLKEHLSAFTNYSGGGYLVFGVENNGTILGVDEVFCTETINKMGNLAAEGLASRVQIEPFTFEFQGKPLLAIHIVEAIEKPIHMRGKSMENSFIRSGGQSRPMSKQDLRQAIVNSRSLRFEEIPAALHYSLQELEDNFNFSEVLNRAGNSAFQSLDSRNERLHSLRLLAKTGNNYVPTNLGVITCAKDFSKLSTFERFAIRVITYSGTSKVSPSRDRIFNSGYTLSLDAVVKFILDSIPHSEVIQQATRLIVPAIPEIAIREILGNAVIHRDYSRSDAYTTVEIFTDRIEITNPGGLFGNLPIDRLIDYPPRTRNEVLADLMKQLRFYEEQGSGIDKTITAMELHALPPVDFRAGPEHFTAVLYLPKKFEDLSKEERINAVYQHACLNFVANRKTTNTTLRERFKFDDKKLTKTYRLIQDAIDAGRVKMSSSDVSRKNIHYLPYWA